MTDFMERVFAACERAATTGSFAESVRGPGAGYEKWVAERIGGVVRTGEAGDLPDVKALPDDSKRGSE